MLKKGRGYRTQQQEKQHYTQILKVEYVFLFALLNFFYCLDRKICIQFQAFSNSIWNLSSAVMSFQSIRLGVVGRIFLQTWMALFYFLYF